MANLSADEIVKLLDSIDQSNFPEGSQDLGRVRALIAARKLAARLETPWESQWRMGWVEVPFHACFKIALDLKVFELILEGVNTLTALASKTGAAEDFLLRILGLIVAANHLYEPEPQVYQLTHVSEAYAKSASLRAGIHYMFDAIVPANAKLADYAREHNYQNPKLGQEVWKYASGTDETLYEWLRNRPEKMQNFATLVAGYSSDRPTWLSYYPTKTLLDTWNGEGPILVDVGGGLGQDMKELVNFHGDAIKGELILQDLPEVVKRAETIGLPAKVTADPYDFFTQQPVKGARAYHFHLVLFNWPDEKAVEILKNTRSALKPGYSSILINDQIIFPKDSFYMAPAMDVVMLSTMNGKVRTLQQWEAICSKAGLSVVKVWRVPEIGESIIEVVLDTDKPQ